MDVKKDTGQSDICFQSSKQPDDLKTGSSKSSETPVRADGGKPVLVDKIKREDPELFQFIFPAATTRQKVEEGKDDEFKPEYREAEFLEVDYNKGCVKFSNLRCGFVESENVDEWTPIFKKTSLRYRSLKDIYLVVELFPPELIAGHSLAYFEFADDEAIVTEDGEKFSGMTLSIEAKLRRGQSYNVIQGLEDAYNIVYLLTTWKDYVQFSTRRYGRKLIRYKLKLTKEQKLLYLKEALTRAFEERSGEMYNSLNNSCLSDQIKILNTVVKGKQKIVDWIIPDKVFSIAAAVPNWTGLLLHRHDLLDDSPIVITQPDKKFYPDKQFKENKIEKLIKKLPGKKLKTGMAALGAIFGITFPIIGHSTLLAGALGGYLGYRASKWLEREANYVIESSEGYFSIDTEDSV